MPRIAFAFAAALICILAADGGHAQEATEAERAPTAEDMIEVAREAYRPPGLRPRCAEGAPGEIVVCAPVDHDSFRVSSPTDDAIAAGEAVDDGIPRASDLFKPPPCVPSLLSLCVSVGGGTPRPSLIDLEALPEPLSPEDAARVFRAEDVPPETQNSNLP